MVCSPEVCSVLWHWPCAQPPRVPPLQPLLAAQAGAQGTHGEFTYSLSKWILCQVVAYCKLWFPFPSVFPLLCPKPDQCVHVQGSDHLQFPWITSELKQVEGLSAVLCCYRCEANVLKSATDIHFLFKLRANNLDSERKTETGYLLFSGGKWWLEKALWTTGISVWILLCLGDFCCNLYQAAIALNLARLLTPWGSLIPALIYKQLGISLKGIPRYLL